MNINLNSKLNNETQGFNRAVSIITYISKCKSEQQSEQQFEQRVNTNKNEKNVLTRKKIKDATGQMVFILDYFIRQKNKIIVDKLKMWYNVTK